MDKPLSPVMTEDDMRQASREMAKGILAHFENMLIIKRPPINRPLSRGKGRAGRRRRWR